MLYEHCDVRVRGQLDQVESVGPCSQTCRFAFRAILTRCAEQTGPLASFRIELAYQDGDAFDVWYDRDRYNNPPNRFLGAGEVGMV